MTKLRSKSQIYPCSLRACVFMKIIEKIRRCANLRDVSKKDMDVNEQPEWFHWAHRRWPFYTHVTVCHVHVLDHGNFTDTFKRFGDLDQ